MEPAVTMRPQHIHSGGTAAYRSPSPATQGWWPAATVEPPITPFRLKFPAKQWQRDSGTQQRGGELTGWRSPVVAAPEGGWSGGSDDHYTCSRRSPFFLLRRFRSVVCYSSDACLALASRWCSIGGILNSPWSVGWRRRRQGAATSFLPMHQLFNFNLTYSPFFHF